MALRTNRRKGPARHARTLLLGALLSAAATAHAATSTPTPATSTSISTSKPVMANATGKPAATMTTPSKPTTAVTAPKPTTLASKPTAPQHRNTQPPVMLLSNAWKVKPVVTKPVTTMAAKPATLPAKPLTMTTPATRPNAAVAMRTMPGVRSGGSWTPTMPVTVVHPKPQLATTTPKPTMATSAARPTMATRVLTPTSPPKTATTTPTTAPKPALTASATKPAPTTKTATTPTLTKPVTATTPSFSERMARTTVTPPVASSGAKASLTPNPAHALPTAHTTMPTTVAPAKVAVAPKSTRPATPVMSPQQRMAFATTRPAWTFRAVQSGASTTAGMHPTTLAARTKTAPTTAPKGLATVTKTTTLATTTVRTTTLAATTGHSTTPAKAAPSPKGALAKTTVATATTKTPAKANVMATSVQSLGARFMEQREQYVYDSLNRRDPFASLVSGSFETEVGTPLLDVSSMKLVGIVWGPSDKFALVEDGHEHGFVLRVGDPVLNGYIAGLTKEELIVKQSSYGDTQTITIQLQRKDGASNAK